MSLDYYNDAEILEDAEARGLIGERPQARIRELTEALAGCVESLSKHEVAIRASGCGCCISALEDARKALGEAGQP